MLWMSLVLMGQLDPNVAFQELSAPQKQRVYMIYQEELRARRDVEEAVAWTSKQSNRLPEGAVRLVVVEMRRVAKQEEDEKARLKAKEKKANPTTSSRRSSSSSRPPRRTPRTPNPNAASADKSNPKKNATGDGVREEGNTEEIHYKQEKYTPFGFRSMCRMVLPEDIVRVRELVPIAVDGRVQTAGKDATVVALTSSDGAERTPIVIVHSRSVKESGSLRKGDLVRAFGWVVRKESFRPLAGEPEVKADGQLFFAMDVDTDAEELPGLVVEPSVTEVASPGGGRPTWNIEIVAKNNGDQILSNVVLEANLVVYGPRPRDADNTALFIIDRLKPGEETTLTASKTSWIDPKVEDEPRRPGQRDDNVTDDAEGEKPIVHVVARVLAGEAKLE